jgi:hypothetical protein
MHQKLREVYPAAGQPRVRDDPLASVPGDDDSISLLSENAEGDGADLVLVFDEENRLRAANRGGWVVGQFEFA